MTSSIVRRKDRVAKTAGIQPRLSKLFLAQLDAHCTAWLRAHGVWWGKDQAGIMPMRPYRPKINQPHPH
jgi:hypothetical protein